MQAQPELHAGRSEVIAELAFGHRREELARLDLHKTFASTIMSHR